MSILTILRQRLPLSKMDGVTPGTSATMIRSPLLLLFPKFCEINKTVGWQRVHRGQNQGADQSERTSGWKSIDEAQKKFLHLGGAG